MEKQEMEIEIRNEIKFQNSIELAQNSQT